MNWNHMLRQTHRWVSVVFTLAVIANFAAMGVMGTPPMWVTFVPLPPLFLLLITGLFMFVLPYVVKRRTGLS